jgi:Holliday junction resolvase RusA-like endonuclease
VKLVEDGLKGIAWHDDEQVAILHMYRHLDRENPRIEIEIRQIHQNT